MRCTLCGSGFKSLKTDLPFKVSDSAIVILKNLPVSQCKNCLEYLIEDEIMERVEEILSKVDQDAELEIVRYAA
ncbi:MAG: YgiT-type zinc finger protein [Nitrospirota bacterium]|nr:YgiT-type zinc finger protein [Nitrospirota bacterium]